MKIEKVVRSIGGTVTVYSDRIEISRGIFASAPFGGLGSSTTIPLQSISSITYKYKLIGAPYLQFVVQGGLPNDPQYRWKFSGWNKSKGKALKRYLEGRIGRASSAPHSMSIAEEIAALGKLKAEGLLTSEEFETRKTKLLAS